MRDHATYPSTFFDISVSAIMFNVVFLVSTLSNVHIDFEKQLNELTHVVRRADDLPDVLVLLNDPRRLHVAQLDLAVREAAHQHHVLSLMTEVVPV